MSDATRVVLGVLMAALALGLLLYVGHARLERALSSTTKLGSASRFQISNERARLARRLAMAAACGTIFIGLAVLTGWQFDVESLKSVLPGFVAMKANTAVGLVFAGAALLLLGRSQSTLSLRLSQSLAIGTALLGLATFSEYAFGVNLGIDQLLFTEPDGALDTLSPGRMAPASAVDFVLLGVAIGLAGNRSSVPAAQRLALLSGLVGLLPLIADLYGAKSLSGIGRLTQMAIHTEVAFVLLSVGTCLVHPTQGIAQKLLANTLGGWLLRRLTPFVLGIPLVLGWLRVHGERRGYFDSTLGVALMVTATTVVLGIAVWWAAGSLTRIDAVRSRAETRALESLEEIDATLYGVGDGVMTTDSDGRIVRMNPVAEHLTGWTEAEAAGKPLKEVVRFVNEKTLEVVDSSVAQVLSQGRLSGHTHQTALIARDGSIRPVIDSGAPIRNASGQIRGAVLALRDQTSERESLAAKQQADANFAEAFHGSPGAMMITSVATRKLVDVNSAFLLETGFSRGELIGHTPEELGLFVDHFDRGRSNGTFLDMGRVNNLETLVRTKAGLIRTCLLSLSTIQLADEPHSLTSLVDISERKRAAEQLQEALLESRRLLEVADQSRRALLSMMEDRKREEERRKELEDKLSHAQKLESIGLLAGGVAHDYNNLTSVILNYTGFAMSAVHEGDPVRADLEQIKKAANRAAALTHQLLAFGRKQVLQPVPLCLNQIVKGMQDMLRQVLPEDINLVLVLAPDLGVAQADPSQMEQVLMNLVVNARDAMPNGGTLTLETANVEIGESCAERHVAIEPGPCVQLTVADTGCGMDEQTKSKLFDPFFTTKEKGKGTGLGLSTVYGIVKQSGGYIWVDSAPGRGTSFKIMLPRELSAIARAPSLPPVSVRPIGSETILVVEDEDALREAARRALATAGYSVLVAANGDEALRISTQHVGPIHLLLTDVVMPGMNGRVLAQELVKTRPELAVLFMSGYTDDAFVHRNALDAGTHFIGKPFAASDLKLKVREVLDESMPRGANRQEQPVSAAPEPIARVLDESAFRMLPQVMLGKLREAANTTRHDKMVELLERLELTEPEIADALRRRVDRFDYDGILRLLGQKKAGGSK